MNSMRTPTVLSSPVPPGNAMNRLLKFAFTGAAGFVVDTSLFALMFHWLELSMMPARSIAFLGAATTTWLGNRWLTFPQAEKRHAFAQWQKFMVTACFSALPNFAVFKMVTILSGTQGIWVYVALIMGVLAGMCSNYFLSVMLVFRQPDDINNSAEISDT